MLQNVINITQNVIGKNCKIVLQYIERKYKKRNRGTMGSIIMHLYISEQIKKKYNFSDEFLVGSILPDVKKLNGENRDKTHYLVERKKDRTVFRLPEEDEYIHESKCENNKMIKYGYIAHLIQDKVWFRDYMPVFGEEIGLDSNGDELYVYSKDEKKIIRTKQEFLSDVYGDYSVWNTRLKEKFGLLNFPSIQSYIKDNLNVNESAIGAINNYINDAENQSKLVFIEDRIMNEYFGKCIEECCQKIEKMMKI